MGRNRDTIRKMPEGPPKPGGPAETILPLHLFSIGLCVDDPASLQLMCERCGRVYVWRGGAASVQEVVKQVWVHYAAEHPYRGGQR